jgi:predicted TIM-barrel fold metal-dependent hydrolase
MTRLVNGGQTLMFSTDYPHWDNDESPRVRLALPDEYRDKILFENANQFYKPRLAAKVPA